MVRSVYFQNKMRQSEWAARAVPRKRRSSGKWRASAHSLRHTKVFTVATGNSLIPPSAAFIKAWLRLNWINYSDEGESSRAGPFIHSSLILKGEDFHHLHLMYILYVGTDFNGIVPSNVKWLNYSLVYYMIHCEIILLQGYMSLFSESERHSQILCLDLN